ncbi:hypothetical protein Hanom_Chr07g00668871 [Helianthus anomalus]
MLVSCYVIDKGSTRRATRWGNMSAKVLSLIRVRVFKHLKLQIIITYEWRTLWTKKIRFIILKRFRVLGAAG